MACPSSATIMMPRSIADLPHRRQNAQRQGDQQRDRKPVRQASGDRNRSRISPQTGHGRERIAEIALGSVAGPFEKLHHQRPVEAIIFRNDRTSPRGVRPAIDAARSPERRVKMKLTTRTVRHTKRPATVCGR